MTFEEELSRKGYETQFLLGEGATSQVFCVKKISNGKVYACKISSHTEWLEAESELLKRLRHSLFPKWEAFWKNQKGGCLIMEYVTGITLSDYLLRQDGIPWQEVIRIAIALADGLVYLQEKNPPIIYKDLKPANTILEESGEIRLLDFGAASLNDGWRIGTPGYSAPELLGEKNAATPASDVYSIGVLMYQMLTKQNPVMEPFSVPVRAYRPDVPAGIQNIIMRCIKWNPKERIPDALTLNALLKKYQGTTKLRFFLLEMQAFFNNKKHKEVIFEKNIYKNGSKQKFFM